ncbi:hypothetical protein AC1031_014321 [Aphanomyces cochlioides]|nr:hypothetical protein AC1031_014321 [Aphanomyces cochlioides]
MDAAKIADVYEDDVSRTTASVVTHIHATGRVDLIQLLQLAQEKPIAWLDDVVCAIESCGNVSRTVVDGVEGWVLAAECKKSSKIARIPQMGVFLAFIFPKREGIRSRHHMTAYVDAYASKNQAFKCGKSVNSAAQSSGE